VKLLLDQDVYASTARFLRASGHDVSTASQLGLAQAPDEELLRIAQGSSRVLVTRDRDFGALVFVRRLGAGVLYLRMTPGAETAVHEELGRVLAMYNEEVLKHALVVITADGHRFRRPAD
jgi:predicted nuclease of predicted toxin-antitoxin system